MWFPGSKFSPPQPRPSLGKSLEGCPRMSWRITSQNRQVWKKKQEAVSFLQIFPCHQSINNQSPCPQNAPQPPRWETPGSQQRTPGASPHQPSSAHPGPIHAVTVLGVLGWREVIICNITWPMFRSWTRFHFSENDHGSMNILLQYMDDSPFLVLLCIIMESAPFLCPWIPYDSMAKPQESSIPWNCSRISWESSAASAASANANRDDKEINSSWFMSRMDTWNVNCLI